MSEILKFSTYKEMDAFYGEIKSLDIVLNSFSYGRDHMTEMSYILEDYYEKIANKAIKNSKIGESTLKIKERYKEYYKYLLNEFKKLLTEEAKELIPWVAYEMNSFSKIKEAFSLEIEKIVTSGEFIEILKEALLKVTGRTYSYHKIFGRIVYGEIDGDSDKILSNNPLGKKEYEILVADDFPLTKLPFSEFEKPLEIEIEELIKANFVILDNPFHSDFSYWESHFWEYEFIGMPKGAYEIINEEIFKRVKENLENSVKLTREK